MYIDYTNDKQHHQQQQSYYPPPPPGYGGYPQGYGNYALFFPCIFFKDVH